MTTQGDALGLLKKEEVSFGFEYLTYDIAIIITLYLLMSMKPCYLTHKHSSGTTVPLKNMEESNPQTQKQTSVSFTRALILGSFLILAAFGATVGARFMTDETFFNDVVANVISVVSLSEESANIASSTSHTNTSTSTQGQHATSSAPIAPHKAHVRLETLGVGIHADGGVLTEATYSASDTIGVRFAVTNSGGTSLSDWNIVASIPTDPVHTFTSAPQKEIKPNETKIFLLTFDNAREGEGVLYITADVDTQSVDVENDLFLPLTVAG